MNKLSINGNYKFPIIVFILLLVGAVGVLGGQPECNTTIYQFNASWFGCQVSSDLTLETGTYYMNSSDGWGRGINITSSDVTLDCASATLIGNYSGTSIVLSEGGINVNIRHCNISKYVQAIDMGPLGTGGNILIEYNNISSCGVGGVSVVDMENPDNSTVQYNRFENNSYVAIRLHSTNNNTASYNWINSTANGNVYGAIFVDGTNNIVHNNTIYIDHNSVGALRTAQDGGFLVSGNRFLNNNIFGVSNSGIGYVSSTTNFQDTIISDNIFYGLYRGFEGIKTNTTISNNNFTLNSNTHLYLSGDNVILVENNEFFHNTQSSEAIRISNSQNNTFKNNTIRGTNNGIRYYNNGWNNSFINNSIYDTIDAIELNSNFEETIADFIGNYVENATDYGIKWFQNWTSTIGFNEINDSEVGIWIDDGVTQDTLDISNISVNNPKLWGYSISSPSKIRLTDWARFLDNANDNNNPSNITLNDTSTYKYLKYSISGTTNGNLTIFNTDISTWQIYNKTSKSFWAESTLSDNSEVNITLSANQEIYIIDVPTFKESNNFLSDSADNNIEGCVNITGTTTKSLRSCISTTFNATVTLNNPLTCDDLTSITYTSDSGAFTQTFTAGTDFTCGSTITISVVGIEEAYSSNTFVFNDIVSAALQEIPEGLDAFASFFVIMAVIIAAVVILLFIGILRGESNVLNLISQENIVKFIAVILAIIFLVVIGLIVLAELAS